MLIIFQGGSVGHLHKLLSIESSSQVNCPHVVCRQQEEIMLNLHSKLVPFFRNFQISSLQSLVSFELLIDFIPKSSDHYGQLPNCWFLLTFDSCKFRCLVQLVLLFAGSICWGSYLWRYFTQQKGSWYNMLSFPSHFFLFFYFIF